MNSANSADLEIDVHAAKQLLDDGDHLLLLDCRTPQEYEFAKIDGALHIPMNEIPQRLAELPEREVAPLIVVYCHSGYRSLQVTHWLREQGFENTKNLTGGIDAWSVQIDPGVPRYQ